MDSSTLGREDGKSKYYPPLVSDQTLSVGTGGSSTLLVESEVGAAVNRDHRNSSSQGDENIESSPEGPCTRDEFGEENSSILVIK